VSMPLRLPKIPHTTDVIMKIIQGKMIPSETALVADKVKKYIFFSRGENSLVCSTHPVKLLVVRQLDAVCTFKSYSLQRV